LPNGIMAHWAKVGAILKCPILLMFTFWKVSLDNVITTRLQYYCSSSLCIVK
jgi:hypothetical protein